MATKIELGTDAQWGVKESGVLAFNRENGVFKAIELASSRASGATYVAESGLIADAEVGVPRIDYTNGVGELLLEPQSTNLITSSEDFSVWTKSAPATLTANYGISPDGTQNSTRVQFTDASQLISLSTSLGIGVACSGFIYVKGTSGETIQVATGGVDSLFVLDGTWQKLGSEDVTSVTSILNVNTYGGSTARDIEVFGAQLEALSYSTSYIRTSGSSVTRIADAVTGNSSLGQVINSSEGVLYVEAETLVDGVDSNLYITLSDNSNTNRVILIFRTSADLSASTTSGAAIVNPTFDQSIKNKIAFKFKDNDFALWVNGVEVGTDTSSLMIGGGLLNTFSLANGDTTSNPFYGRVKELKVYDTALTDAELTTLTTL